MTHSAHLRTELVRQHERIEKRLQELTEAADSGDADGLGRAWTAFEDDLSSNLETEEQELFPLVDTFHPHEVEALKSDHERIRKVVAELGVACDLHTANRAAVGQLVQLLRQHGEHEDQTLYRWVEELAPVDTRRRILSLLARTVRADVAASD